jgi:hypothetical protein
VVLRTRYVAYRGGTVLQLNCMHRYVIKCDRGAVASAAPLVVQLSFVIHVKFNLYSLMMSKNVRNVMRSSLVQLA